MLWRTRSHVSVVTTKQPESTRCTIVGAVTPAR